MSRRTHTHTHTHGHTHTRARDHGLTIAVLMSICTSFIISPVSLVFKRNLQNAFLVAVMVNKIHRPVRAPGRRRDVRLRYCVRSKRHAGVFKNNRKYLSHN